MHRIARVIVLAVVVAGARPPAVVAQTVDVDLGGAVLVVSDAPTAQVFHIVDQLSQWDQYAHKQYVRWAKTNLPLTTADSGLLEQHAALRRARGWGNGFEQAFLVDLSIDAAAQRAVDIHLLSAKESDEEKAILLHFAPMLDSLRRVEAPRIAAFRQRLLGERERLTPVVQELGRFTGTRTPPRIPVFLISNPEETSGGGEGNGGRLVIEVPAPDPMGVLLHESLHLFLAPHEDQIRLAADSAGLSLETFNDGIAYAFAPGITDDPQQTDLLAEQAARFLVRGSTPSDHYVQSYAMAIAIRPVLRAALARGDSFETFLPQAIARWRQVVTNSVKR